MRPSLLAFVSQILISSISQTHPLRVTEEELMTEGCDGRGVELAGSKTSAVSISESVFV